MPGGKALITGWRLAIGILLAGAAGWQWPSSALGAPPQGRDIIDREELARQATAFENMSTKIRSDARKVLVLRLDKARAAKDAPQVVRFEGMLAELDKEGRIRNDSATRVYLVKLREEEGNYQSAFDRAEQYYRDRRDSSTADEIHRELEAFVARICTTPEDRVLLAGHLIRLGKYYVLPDAEREVYRRYDTAERRYQVLQEVLIEAETIKAILQELHDSFECLVEARTQVERLNNLINNGGLKGAPLQQVKAQRTASEDLRLKARGRFDVAMSRAVPEARCREVQNRFDAALDSYRREIAALRPLIKEAQEQYRRTNTPQIQKALESLGLLLGPSAGFREISKRVSGAEKELRRLNIDLKPVSYDPTYR